MANRCGRSRAGPGSVRWRRTAHPSGCLASSCESAQDRLVSGEGGLVCCAGVDRLGGSEYRVLAARRRCRWMLLAPLSGRLSTSRWWHSGGGLPLLPTTCLSLQDRAVHLKIF
jgi:hypothetical protein